MSSSRCPSETKTCGAGVSSNTISWNRTHKHWGFHRTRAAASCVKCSEGQIVKYQELVPIDLLGLLGAFTESDMFYRLVEHLTKLFPTKTYSQELWCEVTKA